MRGKSHAIELLERITGQNRSSWLLLRIVAAMLSLFDPFQFALDFLRYLAAEVDQIMSGLCAISRDVPS